MYARTIHNVLTQGRTVQKGGSNPPNPRQITLWLTTIVLYCILVAYCSNIQILNEVERSKLLHDALFLARAEQLNYSMALDLTEYARKETGLLPWDTIYASFQYINAMMVHRSEHHAFLVRLHSFLFTCS